MLKSQVRVLHAWREAIQAGRNAAEDRDRGEVTAQTALIVLLVGAAIAAGTAIAVVMANNTSAIPSP